MIGRTISHYRIISQLAAGGMGVVYRAEDVRLGREVAVKCVLEDFASDEQALQRLRAEARAASALNHANICTIYDIGEVDGHPFIVMELLKGESLREKLVNGPIRIHKLVDYGIEIADALHAAHTAGIIHRDIKPGNIFVTERGHVKVLDFGLAKLTTRRPDEISTDETYRMTEVGVTLGTVAYMSPEQATGEDLDPRSDLFSLGVVLYECATGQHPFPGSTSAVTLSGILTKTPVAPVSLNPEVPLRLQDVITNCLEKDRELRFQSAADLAADMKRIRRDLDSGRSTVMQVAAARPPGAVADPRTAPTQPGSGVAPAAAPRDRRTGLAVAALGAIAVVAAGAWFIGGRSSDRPPAGVEATAVPPPPIVPAGNLETEIESRFRLAAASLQGGNYRSASTYAAEVLALAPEHAEAKRIRDEAARMLQRFDDSLAEARARLAARDIVGASRALEAARAIDPSAPGVTAVGSLLAAEARRTGSAVPPPSSAPAPQQQRSADAPPSATRPTQAPAVAPATQPSAPAAVPAVPVTPPVQTGAPAGGTIPTTAAAAPSVPEPAPPPSRRTPEGPTPEQDEEAIRQVVASYARAIENKDIGLYRAIRPNLSPDEERRVQEGFRSVASQRVTMTITSISRQGNEAVVQVRRRDTIQAGGRQQTGESQQTMVLGRQKDRWVITSIR